MKTNFQGNGREREREREKEREWERARRGEDSEYNIFKSLLVPEILIKNVELCIMYTDVTGTCSRSISQRRIQSFRSCGSPRRQLSSIRRRRRNSDTVLNYL